MTRALAESVVECSGSSREQHASEGTGARARTGDDRSVALSSSV